MRTDQYVGLKPEVQKLVAGLIRVKSERKYETAWNGTWELDDYVTAPIERLPHKCKDCGEIHFGPQPNLRKQTVVYREFLQAAPWSSGPMYFIALETHDGTKVQESLWTEEEMSEM